MELLKRAGDRLEEEVRRWHQRPPAGLLQLPVRAPPALPSLLAPLTPPVWGCLDPLPKVRLLIRVLSSSTASASPSAGSGSTEANTAPQEEIPGKEAHPEESLVPQEARLRGTQESGCSHCPWPRNPTQEAQLPTPVS